MPEIEAITPYEMGMARLAESGLNGADAKLLGLKFLTAEQTTALDASFSARPSMQLPYFDSAGKPTGFYRIRYLGKADGFEGLVAKPRRYAQAPGTQPELYLSPKIQWKKKHTKQLSSLWITEGELKAAAACACEITTIGLGGVWSWQSKKAGIDLLPALKEFLWDGRDVYLAFDSDLRTNPQVLRALLALSNKLTSLGAKIFMVEIPDGRDSIRQGLDDFIVKYKSLDSQHKALATLAAEAIPFSVSYELWALNAEVAFVKDPGLIVLIDSGQTMSHSDFVNAQYSNRLYKETGFDKAGQPTMALKPIAPAWMKWPARAELCGMTYAPGEDKVTKGRLYNGWTGWGCEPRRGDFSPWRKLLDYMFAKEPAARAWFEQWAAYPLQYPGAKLYTAVVIWGAQGVGKSLTGGTFQKIYGKNFAVITDKELESSFNDWSINKSFIVGEDVVSAENRKSSADILKFMITREEVRIEKKFQPSYVVPDRMNWYFSSNHPDAFLLEDTDRRFFVHEAPSVPMPQEFYSAYGKWLEEGGASALFHHLLRLDLTGFDPKARAMETAAKLAMMRDSKSDLGTWVHQLKEDPASVLRIGSVTIGHDLFTTTRLLALYDPEGKHKATANGLGRELKRAGFRQVDSGKLVYTQVGGQRYYAVRNAAKWLAAKAKDIQVHLNAGIEPKEKKY
jgi:hypothetical protein